MPGKPWYSQSQGSVEIVNQDIKNIIRYRLKDNQSTKWSEGLRYVEFIKKGVKQSPYKTWEEPRVDFSTTSLIPEIIKDIQDEDDLKNLSKVILTMNRQTNQEMTVIVMMRKYLKLVMRPKKARQMKSAP